MQTRKLNKTLAGMLVGGFLTLIAFSESATAVTAQWSHVSVACVPDDTNTTPDRYDAVTAGKITFQGAATGNLWFWCNVLSPYDTVGDNPEWNRLVVTFKDSNANGFVEVRLIRKRKDDGTTATRATFTSTDGIGVRERSVSFFPAFDFVTYAYFVRIQLNRTTTGGDPEIHIVSLKNQIS